MFRSLVRETSAAPGLSLTVISSLEELAPGEWETISGGCGLYLSRPFLLTVERSCETPVLYLTLRDRQHRLWAGLPCYLWSGRRDPGLDTYEPFHMGGRWTLSEKAREELWRPTLVVGSRAGYQTAFAVDPSPEGDPQALVARLAWEVACLADRLRVGSVGWMWLTAGAASQLLPALHHPEDLIVGGPNCAIPIEWQSFSAYLDWLSSSRRRSARLEMERFAASGLTVERCRLSQCYREVAPLAANLQRRYGHLADVNDLMTELQGQVELLDEHSQVLLCQRRDQVVAFTLLYDWGGVLYGRMAGFDYDHIDGTDAYFNLAFYQPLQLAIEQGASRYHLGMASWRPKVMRGADLDPTWILLWAPSAVRSVWRRTSQRRSLGADPAAWWARQFPGQVDPDRDWRWTREGLREQQSSAVSARGRR